MKIVWIIFFLLFTPSMLLAAQKTPDSLNLLVTMMMGQSTSAAKNITPSTNFQKMITVNKNNHEWTLVKEDRPLGTSNVSLLFLKNVRMTAKNIKLNFLIVDINNKDVIISQPKLVLAYGKEGNINLTEAKQKIALTAQAKIAA